MFFVFDGIDGAGKSTQIELFSAWLRERGQDVVNCADPGSTALGNRMREILLGKTEFPIHVRSEMLMFSVARTQLVEEIIRPALESGKTVVCDRYFTSTLVYQGHAGNLPIDDIRSVTQVAVSGVLPDLTFLFDLPVEQSLARMTRNDQELDRMESRGTAYLQAVRDGFQVESKPDSARVEMIDATGSIEQIQQAIQQKALSLFEQRGAQ